MVLARGSHYPSKAFLLHKVLERETGYRRGLSSAVRCGPLTNDYDYVSLSTWHDFINVVEENASDCVSAGVWTSPIFF